MKLERLSVPLRLEQPWNIPAILTGLVVLSVNPVSVSPVSLLQPWNISETSVALLASKLARFNVPLKPLQPWKNPARLVALLVLKLAGRDIELSFEHPLNTLAIFTLLVELVVNPVRVSAVILLQPWNMLDISVALLASKLVRFNVPLRLEQPWKNPARFVALPV